MLILHVPTSILQLLYDHTVLKLYLFNFQTKIVQQ